jgi:hypothetical protein
MCKPVTLSLRSAYQQVFFLAKDGLAAFKVVDSSVAFLTEVPF